MKLYKVLHYSNAWMDSDLFARTFKTYAEAKDYVKNYEGTNHHKRDTYEIVKVIKIGTALQVDSNLVKFKL